MAHLRSIRGDAGETWPDGRDAGTESTVAVVVGLAFVAVAVSTLFAQSMLVRFTAGVLLSWPMETVRGTAIPVGKEACSRRCRASSPRS